MKTKLGPISLVLVIATFVGAAAMSSPADLLPAEAGGWTASGEDAVYKGKELYTYIDGGAELYISYGFKSVVSRTYTRPDQPDIIVDLFDMGSSRDAFGVFAHSRETIDDAVGQGSQYTTGLLLFWRDNYFVSVLASPETAAAKKAVFDIGQRIAEAITDDGPLPEILDVLPADNLIEESIRYFHHYVWLNSHYFIADENILHIDDSTDAVLAKYTEGRVRNILLVIDYPNQDAAEAARADFLTYYLPELGEQAAVQLEDGTWGSCRRVGSVLTIVLNAQSQDRVAGLLDAVQDRVNARDARLRG